jgi:ABC-2 type transport system permease protein
MRVAFIIAGRILRQRLRDRSAIIFAVLTPLGLALAFSAVIPDFSPTFHTTIAVVDEDGGALAQALIQGPLDDLVSAGIADVKSLDTEADARYAVSDGQAGAAIVIPAGFTQAVGSGTPTELRVLGGDNAVSREVVRATLAGFANQVGATQLTIQTAVATGGMVDAASAERIGRALRADAPIAVTDATAARRQATLATFYAAAMAIMFVFFATQYGALAILTERRVGTLNRLLAAPISQGSVVLGGSIAGLLLGLLAMTVLVAATTLVAHATWGPPPLVGALIVAAVIAAVGISTMVATLAKTVEQAGSLNAIVALCLSAIGGVFIPLSQAPEILARVSLITPHAWFLRAIDTLSVPTAGLADILSSVLVLVGMGVVTGAIGIVRARGALVAA